MPRAEVIRAAKNPIISGRGICDPHLHAFNGRIYLFASHDASASSTDYKMFDWQVWSSADMVTWNFESRIRPDDFFIGPTSAAWAIDAAESHGKFYLYFSHGNWQTGVAVADHPAGPYKDALNGPLLNGNSTPTREYDPAVFTDDDGSSYLVFGGPSWAYGQGAGYFIARLNSDMVSLDESPVRVELDHEGDDKASINKIGGRYYLTFASNYAISESVYGPYRYLGNTGASTDHGSYLQWQGQLFNAFTIFDPSSTYRASGICYVHQKETGELEVDPLIVEFGVGQYDAAWNKIEAEWFMRGEGLVKKQHPAHGFDVAITSSGQLEYPHLQNCEEVAGVALFVSCDAPDGATIEFWEGSEARRRVAVLQVPYTGATSWRSYRMLTTGIERLDEDCTLVLTASVQGRGELRLNYMKFF